MQNYKILEKIGEGYFSKVFLCENLIDKIKYAIKFCPKNEYIKYTYDEIRFLKKVQHPNIIRMKEYFEDDKYIYIVLEYIKNTRLDNYNEYIIAEIINTLEYIHSHGYIHGDLNINNILIDENNHIKIIDFGLSRLENEKESKILGDIQFCSPESIKYREITKKSDLWSLGIILYKFYSGKYPFEGSNIKTLSPRILNKEIDFSIFKNSKQKKQLKSLLNKNPIKRMIL